MLEKAQHDPKVRVAAASAVAASGALAAAKVARDRAASERKRQRAAAYRLEPGEAPRDGIGRVARGQLDLTINLLERTPRQDDGGETVHEARKALKRLRTLLRVSRGVIDHQRYRHENMVLRDVGRALSGTRDNQVLLDTLDGLTARYGGALREDAWSGLRGALSAATERSREIGSSRSAAMREVLTDTRARVDTWPLPEDGGPQVLSPGVATVYRRGRDACRAASSDPSAENLHELRKRAKDLWHAAQLLERVGGQECKQVQRSAHRLSDLLGEDHDLAILREYARRHRKLLNPAEAELLGALVGCRQEALRTDAMSRAAELYGRKPKKLLRDLALT